MVDVLHGDVTVVLDVLHLLAVTVGLLQSLDNQGSGGGADSNLIKVFLKHLVFLETIYSNLCLSVLDSELDGDLETLPVAGGLGNVVSDLLGGETEGTNLEWKRNLVKLVNMYKYAINLSNFEQKLSHI